MENVMKRYYLSDSAELLEDEKEEFISFGNEQEALEYLEENSFNYFQS